MLMILLVTYIDMWHNVFIVSPERYQEAAFSGYWHKIVYRIGYLLTKLRWKDRQQHAIILFKISYDL
jgi:hypothetical protein